MFAPKPPLKKDQMDPADMRNLITFLILAAGLYFIYNAYFLKPQEEEMRRYRQAQMALVKTGAAPVKPAPEVFLKREEALQKASQARAVLQNDLVKGSVALKGARFDDLSLEHYFTVLDKKTPVRVLDPKGMKTFRNIEYGWISDDKTIALPTPETLWQVDSAQTKPDALLLFWENGQGLRFERKMALDDHYMVTVTDSVTNHGAKPVTLHPYGLIVQKGVPEGYMNIWTSYEGPIGYIGEELQQIGYAGLRKAQNQSVSAQKGWIGITDKYWLTTLIPPQGEAVKYSYNFSGAGLKDKDNKGFYQTDFLGAARAIPPQARTEVTSHLFVGAKDVFLLENYEAKLGVPKFDLSVDFGWFWFMTKPFFFALHYLGEWTGNMGIAIIILTIIIRASTFPLTSISHHSMAKMKKVGPKIAALREEYGEDKVKLQQELMRVYESEGVNPVSGCFPMLLQIPIFFALYKTFSVTIALRHEPFFGWIQDLTAPDPTTIFNLFGLIEWTPPIHGVGVWPCLLLVGMLLQKNLNPPPQDAIQRDMANYMPFLFVYMMSQLASGIVIYYVFSGLINFLQQVVIMRRLNVPIHLFGETKKEKHLKALTEKGVDVHPLVGMVEAEVETALFGKAEEETESEAAPKPPSPSKPKKSQKKKT